jgi:hypothetical protein
VRAKVFSAMVLATAILPGAFSKTVGGPVSGAGDPVDHREAVQAVAEPSIVREIDDPHSGARWLLLTDANHPGGPGRLVLDSAVPHELLHSGAYRQKAQPSLQPAIRAGERLILEEHSPMVDARLDAIALSSAAVGSAVRVRLIIGGRVVRALAVAPGRAVLVQEKEGRP